MISVIIPTKKEPYLERTIEDLKRNAKGEIEILTEEDEGLGQRALTNKLAVQARGDYIMKTDAHCCFSEGFDEELLREVESAIVAPRLLSLDAENWTFKNPTASNYAFDTRMVMGYLPEDKYPVNETMCLQGSCWLIETENYWDWNVCDTGLGSWGGQGVELGVKAWLNGGKCLTTKRAYYGHLFRLEEKDFPYKRNQKKIDATQKEIIKRFKNRNIKGLIQKFNYPFDWSEEICNQLAL